MQSLLLDEPPDKEQDRFFRVETQLGSRGGHSVPSGLRERLGIDAVRNDAWLSPKAYDFFEVTLHDLADEDHSRRPTQHEPSDRDVHHPEDQAENTISIWDEPDMLSDADWLVAQAAEHEGEPVAQVGEIVKMNDVDVALARHSPSEPGPQSGNGSPVNRSMSFGDRIGTNVTDRSRSDGIGSQSLATQTTWWLGRRTLASAPATISIPPP